MEATPTKSRFWKRKWFLYTVGIILVGWIAGSGLSRVDEKAQERAAANAPAPQTQTAETPAPAPSKSKAEAQKELDDLMALSKKAGLVSSYEFSDSASVVYADATWYTQPVSFKKDFLAKVAELKKAITGYRHFEVRDAYSNEKVAEVTSFSGSLEVYK